MQRERERACQTASAVQNTSCPPVQEVTPSANKLLICLDKAKEMDSGIFLFLSLKRKENYLEGVELFA